MIENAILVNGLLFSDIKLRAARKLTGMATAVPIAVASRAMNTVSMIFSQVTLAVSVNFGPPI